MAKKDVDMLSGSLYKSVLRFLLPVIATNLLTCLFNITDLIVVGRLCGSKAVGAVGATGSIVSLMVNLFLGLATGTSIVVAQSRGSGDEDELRRSVHTTILTAVISGAIITVMGILFSGKMLRLMDTPADIIDDSALYLRIYLGGVILRMIYVFGAAVLRALGDTRSPFRYLTIGGVLNVIFNIFFVTVCHMTVDGVAWGTLISEGVSGMLCLRALMLRKDASRLTVGGLIKYFSPKTLLRGLKIGVPSGLEACMFPIANMIIQTKLNAFGTVVVTGNAAAVSIGSLTYNAVSAIGTAASMFMGQNWGAKKLDRIKKLPRVCLAWSLLTYAVMAAFTAVFIRQLLTLYIKDSPVALEYGVQKLYIMLLAYPFTAIFTVYTGLSRGFGKSVQPSAISLITICGLRVAWITVMLKVIYKPYILFLGFPISYVAAAIATCFFYYLAIRKERVKYILSTGG